MEMSHDEHGERLASIEAKVVAVLEYVRRINGHVDEHAQLISRIQTKCAAHDAMSIGGVKQDLALDEWRSGVDADIKSLRESRAGMKSTASLIGTLLILGIMIWQGLVGRQVQAQHSAEPAAQHQVK